MEKILDNHREDYEVLLWLMTILSAFTFKKIKKLERYKAKIKEKIDIN